MSASVALVTVVWILLHVLWYPHGQIVDYPIYERYGDAMVHGHLVPYRDFRLEYQPGALPVFAVPAALDRLGFRNVFQGMMALCHLTLVLAVLRVRGRAFAAAAALAPLLLGSIVLSRFDLWPAALVAGALCLLVTGRNAGSAILLATGFAAKLWPLALAPLICIWLWRREGRRAVATWIGVAVATAAAWFVPFVALGPRGVGHSFYLQLARPLQVESFGASVLLALDKLGGASIETTTAFGSQVVAGPGVHALTVATDVVEALALAVCYVVFARAEPTTDRLLVAGAAAATVLLAFGKVFSPQYLIWLLALVPLAARPAAAAIWGGALVLTQAYFPRRYWDYASGLNRLEVGIVLLRNLVVIVLLAVLLYALQRARAVTSAPVSSPVS